MLACTFTNLIHSTCIFRKYKYNTVRYASAKMTARLLQWDCSTNFASNLCFLLLFGFSSSTLTCCVIVVLQFLFSEDVSVHLHRLSVSSIRLLSSRHALNKLYHYCMRCCRYFRSPDLISFCKYIYQSKYSYVINIRIYSQTLPCWQILHLKAVQGPHKCRKTFAGSCTWPCWWACIGALLEYTFNDSNMCVLICWKSKQNTNNYKCKHWNTQTFYSSLGTGQELQPQDTIPS